MEDLNLKKEEINEDNNKTEELYLMSGNINPWIIVFTQLFLIVTIFYIFLV